MITSSSTLQESSALSGVSWGAIFAGAAAAAALSLILVLLGWVTPDQLREGRGYAIVGIFILAALITPPDVVSQLLLAIPMCLLYEAGIHASRLVSRKDRDAA